LVIHFCFWLMLFVHFIACFCYLFTFVVQIYYLFCSLLLFASIVCFYCLLHLFLLLVLVLCFSCSLQLFFSTRFGLLLLLFVAKQLCNKLSPTPFPFDLCKFGRSFKLQSQVQPLSSFFQY
jgi:hypothetical protein